MKEFLIIVLLFVMIVTSIPATTFVVESDGKNKQDGKSTKV